MLKKTPLASAISSITLATALAATSVAVPVFAADDETHDRRSRRYGFSNQAC